MTNKLVNSAFYFALFNLVLLFVFATSSSLVGAAQRDLGIHPLAAGLCLVIANLVLSIVSSRTALTRFAAFKSIFAAALSVCLGAVILTLLFIGEIMG